MAGAAPDRLTGRAKPRQGRTLKRRRYWRRAFLHALASGHTIAGAALVAGVPSSTLYDNRKADQDFAAAWDNAAEAGLGVLENEAIRRAVDGVEKPVWYQGEEAGKERVYSDRLLLRALEARSKSWAQRQAVSHEHTGRIAHVVAYLPCSGRDRATCQTCGGQGCEQSRAFEATLIEHAPAQPAPTAALEAAGAAPAPAPLPSPPRPAALPVSTPQTGKRTL